MFVVDDYRLDGTFGPCLALESGGYRTVEEQEEDPFLAIARIFFWRDHKRIVFEDGTEVIVKK